MTEIRPLEAGDRAEIARFVERIPEGDRTFFKEDVADPETVDRWMRPDASRSVAVDGRLHRRVRGGRAAAGVVEPRRRGPRDRRSRPPRPGSRARRSPAHAVREALGSGLTKLVVEVIADQESTIALFRSHGFDPEALLVDHVRDQSGELRDLMILAHSVEESLASMAATGLADGD